MKTQIIQLEAHDDLITVRDKMAWAKAPRILLVWPRKGKVLERLVDLLQLQRFAQSLGAQLGIVTGNIEIKANAIELGVPNFRDLAQAQRQTWRRSRGRKRLNLHLMEHKLDISALQSQMAAVNAGRKGRSLSLGGRLGVFSLGILAVIALMLFFWPSARIELTPQRQTQEIKIVAQASPDIPTVSLSGGLPAREISVQVEGSAQARSRGKVSTPADFAGGVVEFTNLGQTEVVVPAGTIVTTLGDHALRYATQREVRIAAGVDRKAEVRVTAVLPGADGNQPAESLVAIEGPVGLQVAVNNPQVIAGGSDQTSPSPSGEDYKELRVKLLTSLRETAKADLAAKIGAGARLLDGSISVGRIIQEIHSPEADLPGDFANLNLQVEYSAWYIQESDLQLMARGALEVSQPAGFDPIADREIALTFLSEPVMGEDGVMRWTMSAARELQAAVEPDKVARIVAGLAPQEASRELERVYALGRPVLIQLSPDWWFRMPFLSFRIQVNLQ